MSPTDTFVSSCGVNLKPPDPALMRWTCGSLDGLDVADDLMLTWVLKRLIGVGVNVAD